jgi:hypothetical protein
MFASRVAFSFILTSVLSLPVATGARAAIVDTYDFIQNGYFIGAGGPLSVTGSFSGTVEADGDIDLIDLRTISVTFVIPRIGTFESSGLPSVFSFDTTGGSATLDLTIPVGRGTVCVGLVAAFGVGQCAPGGGAGIAVGVDGTWTTADLPVVTLVSSVNVVPEPATWVMMILSAAGLGLAGHRTLRKAA